MEFSIKEFSELNTRELYEIMRARADIFTLEKGMICRDLDGLDYEALHCILTDGGKLIAYLRALVYNTSIRLGRVITRTHGLGHGRILMEESVSALKAKYPNKKIGVHAQHDAVGFYERCGFTVTSDEFFEEGVRHFEMELK